MSRENKRACIAIDVSKGKSHFQGFYAAGIIASEVKMFEHTKSKFAKLIELFESLENENNQKPYVLFENTGSYSKPIETFCQNRKWSYMAIPPLLSAKMRKSDIRPTKTDKIDCATIANVYYLKQLNVTKKNNKIYSDLKALCSY